MKKLLYNPLCMQIDVLYSDEDILKELGERIKAERIRQKMTQSQLGINSGVGTSTIQRAESGESIQFLNIIKILRTLHQLHNLDVLLPSSEMTPMQYLYSKKQKKPERYRAGVTAEKTPPYTPDSDGAFVWGEDR